MSDLVKRLRELSGPRYPDDICGKQLMGSAADRIERLEAVLVQAHGALELIASPKRPDGTWNRDREACRDLAAKTLAKSQDWSA
jgi:hypothetical protein